jgi:membrane fusion protein (multidrug efflux system)
MEGTMSRHSTEFKADQELPAGAVEGLQKADHGNVVAPKTRNVRAQLRKLLLAGTAVAVLAGGGWYGWDYWTVGRFEVSTDDAYVKADNTTIAPKVSGYLTEVLVGDNERIREGQVLARIDDRDFKVALDQAKADVAAAKATLASKQAQLEMQQSIIEAAQATVDVDVANKTFAGSATPTLPPPATAACRMRKLRNHATPAQMPRSSATRPISLRH